MAIVVGPTSWHSLLAYQLGQTAPGGGNLICCSGGTFWIVAPDTSEVSRTWYCREDAVTTATACTTATGWFVPTCAQLLNPGYTCRTYWDSYTTGSGVGARYWSSTQVYSGAAWTVYLSNGLPWPCAPKPCTSCVRAFRCVTY